MDERSMMVRRQGWTTDATPSDATVKAMSAEAGVLPVGWSENYSTRRSPGPSEIFIGLDDAQSSAPHEMVKVLFAL